MLILFTADFLGCILSEIFDLMSKINLAFNIDTLRITDLTEEQMAEDDNMTTANVASTIKKRTSVITPKKPENQGAQVAEKVEQVANLRSILKSKRHQYSSEEDL